MFDLSDAMARLSTVRPIFHSEADFQHALAWTIHRLLPEAQVRLEVSSGRFDRRERIDILVRADGRTCAIELKYKKRKLSCEVAGEEFELPNDGAHDIGRYDFIKDISRLERYIKAEPNSSGYAILLTNDDLYWRESKLGINSAAFFLHEGRVLARDTLLAWHAKTGEGTKKNRHQAFTLSAERTLIWANYSSLPDVVGGNFRFLCVAM